LKSITTKFVNNYILYIHFKFKTMIGSIAALGAGLAVIGAGIGIGQIGGKAVKVSLVSRKLLQRSKLQ
jgi:F0F1-type ATP synthase membrane subunit c/vacuolar-type H+-ATPase subunit K